MSADGVVQAGEPGFARSGQNIYSGYATEIISSHAAGSSLFRVLLTSHFEAFDPDFLRDNSVRRLLSLAEECEPPASVRQIICGDRADDSLAHGKLKWIPLRDSPYSKLPLEEARSFLDAAWLAGETVLVHCREGRNRSAALLIGWLMSSNTVGRAGLLAERSLRASMHHLRTIRTLVDLNIGFIKQLLDLERSLHTGDNVSVPCLWTDFMHARLQTFHTPWCHSGRVEELRRRWSWCRAVIGTITHRQQKLRSPRAHLQTSKTTAQTVDLGPCQATLHGGHRYL